MSSEDKERRLGEAWEKLCRENLWVCKLCGAVPERGQRFDDDLCGDCRLVIRSE